MASREELNARRELAKKLHRAATAKVSRHMKKGVKLEGTNKDPRHADIKHVNKLTAKQLDAHISRLQTFTSRKTQYLPGAGKNAILSGDLYRQFESVKKQVNAKRAAVYESVKDIQIPTYNNMTVSQLQGQVPDHPTIQSPSSHAPHLPVKTTNKGIKNDKQLKKSIKALQSELAEGHSEKIIARDQKVMRKFFKDINKVNKGEPVKNLRKDFWSLTPEQFAFLWKYTRFADAASQDYETAKAHMHDPKGLGEASETFDTQIRHMQNLVNDVKRMRF